MKKQFLLLALFFAINIIRAQNESVVSPDFLSQLPATVIPKFDHSRESDYILYFPMKYAKFLFNSDEKKILENIGGNPWCKCMKIL